MLKHLFALSVFAGISILLIPALGQQAPTRSEASPIVCNVQDNVEDATCREKLKGLFTRKGGTLTLKLDGGKSKTYVGNPAACAGDNIDTAKCVVFALLRYFPKIQSFLIEKAYYECGPYLFVSRHTGSETLMYAIPELSPKAKYLLSIDQSDACDRKYDIAIWSTLTNPPKLEFKYQAEAYENWNVVAWDDDTHIRMKAWISGRTPTGDPLSYDQEAELIRGQSGWSLVLGRKTDHPLQ